MNTFNYYKLENTAFPLKYFIETSPKRGKLLAQNFSMKSAWSILINLRDINIVQVNYVWIMDFAFFSSHTHY